MSMVCVCVIGMSRYDDEELMREKVLSGMVVAILLV